MEEQSKVVSINGTDYKEEEFTDQQKYAVNQVRSLQAKEAQLKFELDQISVAREAFTNMLITSVEVEEQKPEVAEEV
jgi:hypothetical protein